MSMTYQQRVNKNRLRGFSLLEMSIVLIIVATLTGLGIQSGANMMETARVSQTQKKIEQIKRAIYVYRVSNNRIPCPASLTLPVSSVNFGVQGPNSAACIDVTAGAATANFTDTTVTVVEGAVPTKSLNLPDEFAFDGWGNRIRYAASLLYTETDSFKKTLPDDTCGTVQVTDGTGASNFRTQEAVYALVSHGSNGHGAYTRSGSVKSAGSTNVDEQKNCSCNASGVATTYAANYTQRALYQNPASSSDIYDDTVEYQMRWQMPAYTEGQSSANAPFAVVNHIGTGPSTNRLRSFNLKGDILTANADATTAPMPALGDTIPVFTPDDSYLAVGACTAPWSQIATVYKTGCKRLSKTGAVIVSPVDNCAYHNAFSREGKYLGFATSRFQIFSGANYSTYLSTVMVGTTGPLGPIAFSPTDNVAIIGDSLTGGTVFLRSFTYNTSTDTFTPGPTVSIPEPGGGFAFESLRFSKNGRYLAVGMRNLNTLRLYKVASDGSLTPIALAQTGNMATNPVLAAFSPDGSLMAVSSNFRVYIYRVDSTTDTFTYDNDFDAITWGQLAFSPDNKYLAQNNGSVLWKRNTSTGTTFTRVPPASITPVPPNTSNGVVFRNNP